MRVGSPKRVQFTVDSQYTGERMHSRGGVMMTRKKGSISRLDREQREQS